MDSEVRQRGRTAVELSMLYVHWIHLKTEKRESLAA